MMSCNILFFFPPIVSLIGLWVEFLRELTMVQEKNDGINKDMALSPVQQNRPAVRTPHAWLSYCHLPLTPCGIISNSLFFTIAREHAQPLVRHSVWCLQNHRVWCISESYWCIRKWRRNNKHFEWFLSMPFLLIQRQKCKSNIFSV